MAIIIRGIFLREKKKGGGVNSTFYTTNLRELQKLCFLFYLYAEIERIRQ